MTASHSSPPGNIAHPHFRVAQRIKLTQLRANRFYHRHQAAGTNFLKCLFDLVRLLQGFFNKIGLTKFHQHAFRTNGHQRLERTDKQLIASALPFAVDIWVTTCQIS
ncbi:MAG: hypothetical protein DRR06_07685 [Gammaproteobacteria bacterium]|nr:MAG: hypothetical protein DRR06_07685 [Gammaproteobacteria bacterium]